MGPKNEMFDTVLKKVAPGPDRASTHFGNTSYMTVIAPSVAVNGQVAGSCGPHEDGIRITAHHTGKPESTKVAAMKYKKEKTCLLELCTALGGSPK